MKVKINLKFLLARADQNVDHKIFIEFIKLVIILKLINNYINLILFTSRIILVQSLKFKSHFVLKYNVD